MRRVHTSTVLTGLIVGLAMMSPLSATASEDQELMERCKQEALQEGVAAEDRAAYVEECVMDAQESETGGTEQQEQPSKEKES